MTKDSGEEDSTYVLALARLMSTIAGTDDLLSKHFLVVL